MAFIQMLAVIFFKIRHKNDMNAITALLQTDFGNPDGLYDHNLENYFLDQKYWEDIIEKPTYYVVGRKGTGKSAIYNWINNRQKEKGIMLN
jgi:polynucleotide 5'-kinase involved in rRNA processing